MKIERIIEKEDGLKVKLVAEIMAPLSGGFSITNYVLTQQLDGEQWKMVKVQPSLRDLAGEPLEDFIQSGRRSIFYYVTLADITDINQEMLNRYDNYLKKSGEDILKSAQDRVLNKPKM